MTERASILRNREPLMGVRHSVFDRYRDSTLRLLYRWAIIIAYVGLMAPLVIVIVASFSKKRFFDFPPSLDSLGVLSYTQLIQHAELKRSLLLSVELAVTTMVVTMAISALAAYAIDRFRFPGRTQVELVLMAPLILPPSVLAIAVLVFISTAKIDPSFWILAGAHVLITIPFALRVMLAGPCRIRPIHGGGLGQPGRPPLADDQAGDDPHAPAGVPGGWNFRLRDIVWQRDRVGVPVQCRLGDAGSRGHVRRLRIFI